MVLNIFWHHYFRFLSFCIHVVVSHFLNVECIYFLKYFVGNVIYFQAWYSVDAQVVMCVLAALRWSKSYLTMFDYVYQSTFHSSWLRSTSHVS